MNNNRKVRLQKYIAEAGIASRRKAEELIREGRVKVNNETIRILGISVDPYKDKVEVDGHLIRLRRKRYIVIYKPRGYICTRADEKGRKCIFDLLPVEWNFLFPVGRLDRSSEGLLILTNDGELAYRLTHPKFQVPKTYLVTINGNIQKPQIVRLLEGIEDRGQLLRAKSVKLLKASSERSELEIILTEGKNREIRRMFNRLGFKVHRLIRTRIGPIHLGELRVGKWRFLTKSEVQALYNSANRMD